MMRVPDPYFFNLREKATALGTTPASGAKLFVQLTRDPVRTNPVNVLQLGLGALQLGEEWLSVVGDVAAWVRLTVDKTGRLPYRFAMPHTFPLAPPWCSALAQGEAASFLVRAAVALQAEDLQRLALQVTEPLHCAGSELVALTPEGPVLQEYPTSPPAHVLNGWITSLWGLYDVGAGDAFAAGVAAVAARLHLYRTAIGWSRYDLYPHPVANVASGFYHRLHISHLRALHRLAPEAVFADTADRWEAAAESTISRSVALSRKALFRVVRPRWHRVS